MKKPESLRLAESIARATGVNSLATGALENPKVRKSATVRGVLTLPVHLAPADSAGLGNVCPRAGACRALCLDGAGNPAHAKRKARARINRARLFFEARAAFMTVLTAEIAGHVAAARMAKMAPAVRLNATSDVLYERIPVTVAPELAAWARKRYRVQLRAGEHASIMDAFPRVQFYDYTKIPVKHRARRPANYHLTYSYDPQNMAATRDAIAAGFNVAVLFTGKTLPDVATIAGATLPVLDGDEHDFRPVDAAGHFVGLRFKRITSPGAVARLGRAAATGAGFAIGA